MDRSTSLLAASTLFFAASTVWFARELHQERGRTAATMSTSVVTAPPPLAAVAPSGEPPVAAPLSPSPPATPARTPDARMNPARSSTPSPSPEEQLRRYEDAREREQMKAARRATLREQSFENAKRAGLTRDELDRVTDLRAEQTLAREEARLRCSVMRTCDPRSITGRDAAADRSALSQLLGAEKADQLLLAEGSAMERSQVERFNARLPKEHELSASQTEQLVTALVAQRREAEATATAAGQRYGTTTMLGASFAMIVPNGPEVPLDEKLAALEDASKRVRGRVRLVLTAAQLDAFDEAQGYALESTKRMLEEQARRAQSRQAARQ